METLSLEQRILHALKEIRPFLESDGGDISLVSIDNGTTAKVQLHGACVSCSVNQMTLKLGVEQTIKKHAPEIEHVESITLNFVNDYYRHYYHRSRPNRAFCRF